MSISKAGQRHWTSWVFTFSMGWPSESEYSALYLLSQVGDALGLLTCLPHSPRWGGRKSKLILAEDSSPGWESHPGMGHISIQGASQDSPSAGGQALPKSQSRDSQGRKGPQRPPSPISDHLAKPYQTDWYLLFFRQELPQMSVVGIGRCSLDTQELWESCCCWRGKGCPAPVGAEKPQSWYAAQRRQKVMGSLRIGSLEVLAVESPHSIVWELHLESSSFIHSGTQRC